MKKGVLLLLVVLALGNAASADSVMSITSVSMSSSDGIGGVSLIPGMGIIRSPGMTSLLLLGSSATPAIIGVNPLVNMHTSPSLIMLSASNPTLIPGFYTLSLLPVGQNALILGSSSLIGMWPGSTMWP